MARQLPRLCLPLRTMSKRQNYLFEKPIASQYSVPSGAFCIEILVPDALEHLYLVQGLLAACTKPQFWDGTDDEKEALAAIWQEVYSAMDWESC